MLGLESVGIAVLTEGIKFLYGQATDLLREWRARGRGETDSSVDTVKAAPPPDTAFDTVVSDAAVDTQALERLEQDLRELRAALTDYVDELEPIDPANSALLDTIDALRVTVEAITGRQLTFKGEKRDATAPTVRGEVDVDTVAGYAAGVRARSLVAGAVHGSVRARTAEKDSKVIGVDIGRRDD